MNKNIGDLKIEGARIAFRNFAGKEGTFNPPGKRSFCVMLDSDISEQLIRDGWNVKMLKPRDPEDGPQPYINVAVSYTNIPPKIWMITDSKKVLLDEDSVSALDYAEIENVDLIISPYVWEMNGKTGVKAYTKTMYVKIKEDEFASKYSNVPDSAAGDALPFD